MAHGNDPWFGDSGTPFGFDPTGPPGPPPFAEEEGFCNLYIDFKMTILSKTTPEDIVVSPGAQQITLHHQKVELNLSLSVSKRCTGSKAPKRGVIQILKRGINDAHGSLAEVPSGDICDRFEGIEDSKTIDNGTISGLMKDLSNASNNAEGEGNSLGDFMSELCNQRGAGSGFYEIRLRCTKNLGTCVGELTSYWTGEGDCNEQLVINVDIPNSPDQPFGGLPDFTDEDGDEWAGVIGGRYPVIDPCLFSKLLKCWKENPDIDTALDKKDEDDLISFLPLWELIRNKPTDATVDGATKLVLTALAKACEKK